MRDVHTDALLGLMDLPFIDRPAPTTLVWHYTTLDGLASILQSHTFWIGSSTDMNDPLELTTGRNAINAALLAADITATQRARVEAYLERSREVADAAEVFILSASTDGDSLSQWRAYASDGKGVAIGMPAGSRLDLLESFPFDATTDLQGAGDINQFVSPWRRVTYAPRKQARSAAGLIELLATLADPSQKDPSLSGYLFNDLLPLAYAPAAYAVVVSQLKASGYKDEREVRIVATATDTARFHHQQDTPDGARRKVHLTGIPQATQVQRPTYSQSAAQPLPIAEIRVGPKAGADAVQAILQGSSYSALQISRSTIQYR